MTAGPGGMAVQGQAVDANGMVRNEHTKQTTVCLSTFSASCTTFTLLLIALPILHALTPFLPSFLYPAMLDFIVKLTPDPRKLFPSTFPPIRYAV